MAPDGGACVSETYSLEKNWQHAYWGSNCARLASVKRQYDPKGLSFVDNRVGSEDWSADGFTKVLVVLRDRGRQRQGSAETVLAWGPSERRMGDRKTPDLWMRSLSQLSLLVAQVPLPVGCALRQPGIGIWPWGQV